MTSPCCGAELVEIERTETEAVVLTLRRCSECWLRHWEAEARPIVVEMRADG